MLGCVLCGSVCRLDDIPVCLPVGSDIAIETGRVDEEELDSDPFAIEYIGRIDGDDGSLEGDQRIARQAIGLVDDPSVDQFDSEIGIGLEIGQFHLVAFQASVVQVGVGLLCDERRQFLRCQDGPAQYAERDDREQEDDAQKNQDNRQDDLFSSCHHDKLIFLNWEQTYKK